MVGKARHESYHRGETGAEKIDAESLVEKFDFSLRGRLLRAFAERIIESARAIYYTHERVEIRVILRTLVS